MHLKTLTREHATGKHATLCGMFERDLFTNNILIDKGLREVETFAQLVIMVTYDILKLA